MSFVPRTLVDLFDKARVDGVFHGDAVVAPAATPLSGLLRDAVLCRFVGSVAGPVLGTWVVLAGMALV